MLVGIVNKKRMLMDEIIKPMGLSRLEWQILSYLDIAEGALTQKAVNNSVDTDAAFVARALDKLEKKKLIKRKINQDDKRQRDIVLTAKGRPVAKKLYSYGEKINESLMEGLSVQEREILLKLTGRVEANIKDLCESKKC